MTSDFRLWRVLVLCCAVFSALVNVIISVNDWSRLINSIKPGETLFEKQQLRIFSLRNKKIEKRYDIIPYLQRLMIQSFELSIMLESLEQK